MIAGQRVLYQRDEKQRSPEDDVRRGDDHEHLDLLHAFPFDAQQVIAHPLVFFHGAQTSLRTNQKQTHRQSTEHTSRPLVSRAPCSSEGNSFFGAGPA